MHVEIGKIVKRLPAVTSTNTEAARLIKENRAPEGTVILADFQTHGRGQQGNQWQSNKGENILLSLILYPGFLKAIDQFYLSMAISNAVAGFLLNHTSLVKIKWPNDIIIGRKKVAGILIENTLSGPFVSTTVAGTGININQDRFSAKLPNPTSLKLETNTPFNLDEVFTALCASLNQYVNMLYNQELVELKTTYLNYLFGLNEWKIYVDSAGRFEGCIVDVTSSGMLMVKHRNGAISNYGFKEIAFII